MKKLIVLVVLLIGLRNGAFSVNPGDLDTIYSNLGPDRPSWGIFNRALEGYRKIEKAFPENPDKQLLTIIDLNIPSNGKRLRVIDLEQNTILFNTYVSHGRNSGDLHAEKFSNISGSWQTSLGFYLTGDTYIGKNGYSMYLNGLEKEFKHLARERAIVMHGAWYAKEEFIRENGRLGRSFGCPAIPPEIHRELIDVISDGTVLFIYREDDQYLKSSPVLSRVTRNNNYPGPPLANQKSPIYSTRSCFS